MTSPVAAGSRPQTPDNEAVMWDEKQLDIQRRSSTPQPLQGTGDQPHSARQRSQTPPPRLRAVAQVGVSNGDAGAVSDDETHSQTLSDTGFARPEARAEEIAWEGFLEWRAAGPTSQADRAQRRPDVGATIFHGLIMLLIVAMAAVNLSSLVMYGGPTIVWVVDLTFIIPVCLGVLATLKACFTKSGDDRIHSLDKIFNVTSWYSVFHVGLMELIVFNIALVCMGLMAGPWLALTIPVGLLFVGFGAVGMLSNFFEN